MRVLLFDSRSIHLLITAGIVLIGLGAIVPLRGRSLASPHDGPVAGDLQVTAAQHQLIPPWMGGLAIITGVTFVAAGVRRRV